MFSVLLKRHRDLLIFGIYAAILGAGWRLALFFGHTTRFPYNRTALAEEVVVIFFLALSAGLIGGLIARRAGWPADVFFAFLMAWLCFGALAIGVVLYWGIEALIRGTITTHEQLAAYFIAVPGLPILALFFSSGPALVGCLVYQGAKFLIVGRQRAV